MTKSRKLSQMGRRRFLNTLTTLGVSGTAVAYMSQDTLAELTDDPTEEVPRLSTVEHVNHEAVVKEGAPPEREPNYYTISRDEWAVVESAHDAKDKVNRLLSSIPGTDGVTAGVTTITNNQSSEEAVVVKRTITKKRDGQTVSPTISEQKLRDELPASVSGTAGDGATAVTIEDIPVIVETETLSQRAYYDYNYRPVPGGPQIDDDNTDGWEGTGGTPAYNNDAGKYDLVTAGHILSGSDGDRIHQPDFALDDSNYIGPRRDNKYNDPGTADPAFDAGVIDLDPDEKYQLADDDGTYRDRHIVGIVAEDEIRDNKGNTSYELHKQGNKTGINKGSITEVYDVSYDTNADDGNGDSGGPHYKEVWDDNYMFYKVYIAGIHYAGTGSSSRATMMDEIETRYSLSV